jgi:hypothetical protein
VRKAKKTLPRVRPGPATPYDLPRKPQAVEKVVVGPIGSLKQLQNTSKPVQSTTKLGFKALERGSENNTRELFNTLTSSRHFGE